MDFSEALIQLKSGKQIQRSGWNGKGMYLFLLSGRLLPQIEGRSMSSFIVIKDATDKLVPWLASQSDVLAEDWQLVD